MNWPAGWHGRNAGRIPLGGPDWDEFITHEKLAGAA